MVIVGSGLAIGDLKFKILGLVNEHDKLKPESTDALELCSALLSNIDAVFISKHLVRGLYIGRLPA